MNVVPGDPLSQYISPVCDSLHMFMQPGGSQTASGANVNSPVCFLLLKMQRSLITDDIEHIAGSGLAYSNSELGYL